MDGQLYLFTAMADFPNRINELRRAAKLSQEALGKAIGCSKMHVSGLERGTRPLTLDWMQRIAAVFTVSPADLLNRDDNPMRLEDEERRLIESYRQADPDTRENLRRVHEALVEFRGPPRHAA